MNHVLRSCRHIDAAGSGSRTLSGNTETAGTSPSEGRTLGPAPAVRTPDRKACAARCRALQRREFVHRKQLRLSLSTALNSSYILRRPVHAAIGESYHGDAKKPLQN